MWKTMNKTKRNTKSKRMEQICNSIITSGSSVLPLGLTSMEEDCEVMSGAGFEKACDISADGILEGPCGFEAIDKFHGCKNSIVY